MSTGARRGREARAPRPHERSDVLYGRRPVLESLKAGRPAERVLIAEELASSRVLAEIRRRAGKAAIPVRVVPRVEIERVAPGGNHQGVVAVGARYRYVALESMLGAPEAALLFLDGVMDPNNLGSLLRSAEGAGFTGAVIPTRRAAAVTPAARRASAGASEVLDVARVPNLASGLERARRSGLWIVGLCQDGSQHLWSSELMEPPVGLVLGAEDRGLSDVVRARCDALVSIPMRGKIDSLNVASAGAIAMFEIVRRVLGARGEQGAE